MDDIFDLIFAIFIGVLVGAIIYIGQSLFGPIFNQGCDTFATWKQLPITYSFDESVPKEYANSIHKGAKNWNQRFNQELIVYDVNSHNKIYWITETWDEWSHENAIGATSSRLNGKTMVGYSIAFNAQDFKFYNSYKDEVSGAMHLESIATHEFGHALGLNHTRFGVMQPGNTYNVENFDLSSLDCSF